MDDVEHIFTETSYVVGVAKTHGGSGDPSPYTARGVYRGMEACCQKMFGSRALKEKTIVIQGVGSVGRSLGEILDREGAKIFFTDINERNIDLFKEKVPRSELIAPEEIFSIDCDIYAPCALGATLNDETVETLKAKIVAGAANNQLAQERHGEILSKRGILYAPDYLINAGGLMSVSIEFEGWSDWRACRMVDTIYETTLKVFKISEEKGIPVTKAIDLLAEARIESIKNISGRYFGTSRGPRFPGRRENRGALFNNRM